MNETARRQLGSTASLLTGVGSLVVSLATLPFPNGLIVGGAVLIVFLAAAVWILRPKRRKSEEITPSAPTVHAAEEVKPFVVDEPWIELHTSAASSPTHVVLLIDPDRSTERDYIDEVWAYSPDGHRRTFYRKSPDGGDSLAPTLMGPNNPPPASVHVRWTDDRGVHEADVVPHETYSSGT